MLRRSNRINASSSKVEKSLTSRTEDMPRPSGRSKRGGTRHNKESGGNLGASEADETADARESVVERNDESDDDDLVPLKRGAKHRKVALSEDKGMQKMEEVFRKTKGRRGLLTHMKEMPLDVVFEIFVYLGPMDVLNLAWTSKDLRDILMHRSAIPVWRAARDNIDGLPGLPDDLSEPQYAHLAFYIHCHYCGAQGVTTVTWTARVRCCQKCFPDHFMTAGDLQDTFVLPRQNYDIVPSVEKIHTGRRRARSIIYYHVSALEQASTEYAELDEAGRAAWYNGKLLKFCALKEHAARCEIWREGRMNDRSRELCDARERRREAIYKRLTDLGWGEELQHLERGTLDTHKLIKQPKDLTDRIWNNIKDTLIEYLADAKAIRLEKLRQATIKIRSKLLISVRDKYMETQPVNAIVPPLGDIAMLTSIRAIIRDTPIGETVTVEQHFAPFMEEELPKFTNDWHKKKDEELLKIMQNYVPDATIASFNLATTFFDCRSCGSEGISYPRILAHACLSRWGHVCQDDDILGHIFSVPWNTRNIITFHAEAYERAKSVLKVCGLDPEVALKSEVVELDVLVECLRCLRPEGRLLMRVARAVIHEHVGKEQSWNLVTGEDKLRAEQLETPGPVAPYWAVQYRCRRCNKVSTYSDLKKHVEAVHAVILPLAHDDIVFDIDTPYYNCTSVAFRLPVSKEPEPSLPATDKPDATDNATREKQLAQGDGQNTTANLDGSINEQGIPDANDVSVGMTAIHVVGDTSNVDDPMEQSLLGHVGNGEASTTSTRDVGDVVYTGTSEC